MKPASMTANFTLLMGVLGDRGPLSRLFRRGIITITKA
jgi:hypothetical protein